MLELTIKNREGQVVEKVITVRVSWWRKKKAQLLGRGKRCFQGLSKGG